MTTTLPKTTPEKQAARTQRHYAKQVAAAIERAATTYGCEPTLEAVQATLDKVALDVTRFRRSQSAAHARDSLQMLLREQAWAAEPGNLLIRYDEVLPGDQLISFAYNIARSGQLRAIVDNEVVEVRPDGGLLLAGERLAWHPRKTTTLQPVHRPTSH